MVRISQPSPQQIAEQAALGAGSAWLDLVNLKPLMDHGMGVKEVSVALLDGPIAVEHPGLADALVEQVMGRVSNDARRPSRALSKLHGTFVAGILVGSRSSGAPAICPGCRLLHRPIFSYSGSRQPRQASVTSLELAEAIVECVNAGAKVLNLSAATTQPSMAEDAALQQALTYAALRDVIVIAAGGNRRALGSWAVTRHPWTLPVVGYVDGRRPMPDATLGRSMGRWGVGAPGSGVVSLSADGGLVTLSGSSFAAAFVTGTVALLRSEFPEAKAAIVKRVITAAARGHGGGSRSSVLPPLLDGWAAFQMLRNQSMGDQ